MDLNTPGVTTMVKPAGSEPLPHAVPRTSAMPTSAVRAVRSRRHRSTAATTGHPRCAPPQGLQTGCDRQQRRPRAATTAAAEAAGASSASRRVLVLGGTGFAGAEVTKAFLRSGYDVVAVSRRASSPALNVRHPLGICTNEPLRTGKSALL